MRFSDPTGHKCVGEEDGECEDENGKTINGAGGFPGAIPKVQEPGDKLKTNKPVDNMSPGDIVTFDVTVNGETVTHNYMLGLLEDGSQGFWDLDSREYVEYTLAVSLIDGSTTWTTFKKTDPKTFNSYDVMSSSGNPAAIPSFNVSWTGGMDDNPSYVEIRTTVDRENAPTAFAFGILGPALVASFWMDAKPSITPLSQSGYYPLTNYVAALKYLAEDGPALERYPVIHLK